MYLKFDNYCEGLVFFLFLDEGMGLIIEGIFYILFLVNVISVFQIILVVNMIIVQFLIYFGEFFGWVFLGVYMMFMVNYSFVFRNVIFKEFVVQLCYK